MSFVGVKGEGVRGIIALDDVTLYKSTCSSRPALLIKIFIFKESRLN